MQSQALTKWTSWKNAHDAFIASLEYNLSRDQLCKQLNVARAIRSSALLLAPLNSAGGQDDGDPRPSRQKNLIILHHEWIFFPLNVKEVRNTRCPTDS